MQFVYFRGLNEESFKNVKDFARSMIAMFGSTYLCEQTFSKMNYVKSKYRSRLTDENLKAILKIGGTKFEPKWPNILNNMLQFHKSH